MAKLKSILLIIIEKIVSKNPKNKQSKVTITNFIFLKIRKIKVVKKINETSKAKKKRVWIAR